MKKIRTAALVLGLVTAVMIFFQFHVALPSGVINLNVADPFAILGLAIVCLRALVLKQAPQWRVAGLNRILIILSILFLIGFVIGWMKIGITQWALSGRLIGWAVLLGYLGVGYLLAAHFGTKGIRHLLEVLATTAILVIVWHVTNRLLYSSGFEVPPPTRNFEGFSGNRNAFAFQLLTVIALLLAYSRVHTHQFLGDMRSIIFITWKSWLPLGFLIAGVVWSGSRAGMLALVILLLIGASTRLADRKSVTLGVLLASLLWSGLWMAQSTPAQSTPAQSTPAQSATVQSTLSGEASNQERWTTLVFAYQMWRKSPFFGEGLGVFIANSTKWLGHPTVIHSTPVWILAEFGLLGAFVFSWALIKLGLYSLDANRPGKTRPRSALLLLLLLFIVFSQFHEIFYQRIFWLVAGVLLAAPLTARTESSHLSR